MSKVQTSPRSSSGGSTVCPFCGTETGIERAVGDDLGALSVGELETLVRNEWRRRIGHSWGRDAYRRRHLRTLVRALIVYALHPDSEATDRAAEDALWEQVAILESWGLNRRAMKVELFRLSQAIWDVLSQSGLQFDRTVSLTERIDRKLQETLGWPD